MANVFNNKTNKTEEEWTEHEYKIEVIRLLKKIAGE